MRYDKPALTFDQQIELLESRGLIVPDKARAANYLSNISYYRLSAYMLPFKVAGVNEFQANVTFDDVLHLYLFDREFRLLIFDAIERIEIAFRTQMSYQLAHAGGAFWFEDRNHFRDANRWREQLENLDVEVNRAKEVFKDQISEGCCLHAVRGLTAACGGDTPAATGRELPGVPRQCGRFSDGRRHGIRGRL